MRNSTPAISGVAAAFAFVAILAILRLWIHLPILLVAGVGLAVLFVYSFALAFLPPFSKHRALSIARMLLAVLPGSWAAACFIGLYTRNGPLTWAVILFGIVFHFAITRRYLSRLPKLINGSRDAA